MRVTWFFLSLATAMAQEIPAKKPDCLAEVCLGSRVASSPPDRVYRGPLNKDWQLSVKVCSAQVVSVTLVRAVTNGSTPPSDALPGTIFSAVDGSSLSEDYTRLIDLLPEKGWNAIDYVEGSGLVVFRSEAHDSLRGVSFQRQPMTPDTDIWFLMINAVHREQSTLCKSQQEKGL